jgi:hypothetical protein
MLSVCLTRLRPVSRSASVVDSARRRVSVGSTSFNTTRSHSNGATLFQDAGSSANLSENFLRGKEGTS